MKKIKLVIAGIVILMPVTWLCITNNEGNPVHKSHESAIALQAHKCSADAVDYCEIMCTPFSLVY